MHRNIARAYDYLKREHDHIRAVNVKFLAQNDRSLERHLFRADLDSPRDHEEIFYTRNGSLVRRGDAFSI